MKIKILHITSSLNIGGAETVLFNLVRSLNTDLFEQEVMYFHEGPFVEQLRVLNIPVHHVQGGISLYDPIFWIRLARLIKQIRPSCIHSLLWSANFCSKIIGYYYKIPVIASLHHMSDHQGAVRNFLDRVTAPLWKHGIAVSQQVAQSYVFASSRTSMSVIPNGIELPALPQVVDIPVHLKNKFIVGAVGRFVPVKRFDLLIKSFALLTKKVPNACLLIIGYGDQYASLKKLIKILQLEEFVFLVQGKSTDYYPIMSCFIQTSASEGFGLALVEAMAHQLPSIVAQEGQMHPIITDGYDGLHVGQVSEATIFYALERLYSDEGLCKRLGRAARSTVELNFTLTNMVARYERTFSGVVHNKN